MSGKIFINYRRGDDPGHTGRLFDRLQDEFDPQQLFLDVDNIAPGLDFVRELDDRVAECDVLLAVIGKGWIDARDAAGKRRLEDPDDFVRLEIEAALNRDKRVIPVLVGEASMPRADELPDALRPLARRNAVRLTHERFRADVQGLVKALQQALKDIDERRRRQETEAAQRAEEEARKRLAEIEVQQRAAEERRLREAEAAQRAEEEARRKEAEAAQRAEEERTKLAEIEAQQRAAEEGRLREAEAAQRAEEEARRKEAEAAQRAEEERKKLAEVEAQRRAAEERRLREAEAAQRAEEEESRKKVEAAQRAEAERKNLAEIEAQRRTAEERRLREAEAARRVAEDRRRQDAAAKQRAEEQQAAASAAAVAGIAAQPSRSPWRPAIIVPSALAVVLVGAALGWLEMQPRESTQQSPVIAAVPAPPSSRDAAPAAQTASGVVTEPKPKVAAAVPTATPPDTTLPTRTVAAPPQAAPTPAAPPAPTPDEVAWLPLQGSNDVAALERFVAQFPDSPLRHDAEVRIAALAEEAAWNRVKDSNDPDELRQFIEQFPDSPQRADAEQRIASLPPAVLKSPATPPAPDAHDLARSLQVELQRVGCFNGAVNGEFNDATKAAWQRFIKLTSISIPPDLSPEAVNAVRAVTKRVCPLLCARGQHAEGDICVVNPAPPPKPPVQRAAIAPAPAPVPAASPPPTGAGPKGFRCLNKNPMHNKVALPGGGCGY